MIATQDIQYVSDYVEQKAVGGRVYRRSDTEFLFVPPDKNKARRIVSFLPSGRVLCVDTHGEQCPANSHSRPCYHCFRVALFIYRSQRLRELRQAA